MNLPPGGLAVFGDTEWIVNEIVDNSADSGSKSYKLVRKITNVPGKNLRLLKNGSSLVIYYGLFGSD